MKNELLGGPFRFSGPRVAILTGFYRICKVPLCTANVLVRASLDPNCRKFSDVERRLRSLKVTYALTRPVLRAVLPEKEGIPRRTGVRRVVGLTETTRIEVWNDRHS